MMNKRSLHCYIIICLTWVIGILTVLLGIVDKWQIFNSYGEVYLAPLNESQYNRFCLQVKRSISLEKPSIISSELRPSNETIPYSYSRWQSITILPRLISPCEHAIFMHLLSLLVKHVFKKYNIQYMMMSATLLGKLN